MVVEEMRCRAEVGESAQVRGSREMQTVVMGPRTDGVALSIRRAQ